MRRIAICALMALLILAIPADSFAHFLWHADAREPVEGIDLSAVRLRADGRLLVMKGKTPDDPAFGSQAWSVRIDFDSRGDERTDFFFLGRFDGGTGGFFDARIYRRGHRGERSCRRASLAGRNGWRDEDLDREERSPS